MPIVVSNLPKRWTGWHDESIATSSSPNFTTAHDGSQNYATYSYIADAGNGADGDTFTQSVFLAAGTYTLSMLGITTTSGPKVDIYLDGVLALAGIDWYSGSTTYNVTKTGSITLATDGYHVLKFVTNGQNASGDGKRLLYLTKFSMKQASD